MNCLICKKKFIKKTYNNKFCSDKCKKENKVKYWKKYWKFYISSIYMKLRRNKQRKYSWKHRNQKRKYDKKYYKFYQKKLIKQQKKYYQENKEKIKYNQRLYYLKNKKKINIRSKKYNIKRRKKDINFKIMCILRKRIWAALKRKSKLISTINLLGCSVKKLRKHLEKQFKPGMSWKTYGKGWNGRGMKQWHIDHIKPCASFDLSKPEEQKKCFHYTNLQPLWAKENLIKHTKIC